MPCSQRSAKLCRCSC